MSISQSEINRRYTAIREWMRKNEAGCLLVAGKADNFNRGNIRYLTTLGNGGYCLFPLSGTPLLTTGRKAEYLSRPGLPVELRETGDPLKTVKQELPLLAGGQKIGIIGLSDPSDPFYLSVKEQFGARLIDATPIFEQLRLIKSPEEIEKMRMSAWIADKVFYKLQEIIRPGLSDYEIYGEVKRLIYSLGCEYSMELIDADGARMNMKFNPVGDRLSADGTLFMEITPAYDGYYGQLPVVMPVVSPPAYLRQMFKVWVQAHKAGESLLKPGTRVGDICRVMLNTVREGGFISPFRPGHALGLDAIDFWSLTEDNNTLLKPGMTLAVHPPVLREMGGDGIGMGYTYLITESGFERFSKVELTTLY
jgi:Xaa-Pro aminopeptidase